MSRYLLKISTTADCVVQTLDLLLVVGTSGGRLVVFDLNVLEEGRCVYQYICTVYVRIPYFTAADI